MYYIFNNIKSVVKEKGWGKAGQAKGAKKLMADELVSG